MLNKDDFYTIFGILFYVVLMSIVFTLVVIASNDNDKRFKKLEQELIDCKQHKKYLIMPKHYVTFGSNHKYLNGDVYIDNNTVVRYDAEDATKGREIAFQLFGTKFSFEYHETNWKEDNMKYFPKGYVDIDFTKDVINLIENTEN